MKNFPDLPPVWTLAMCALSAILAWSLPIVSVSSSGARWLGLFWIVLAVVFVLWSATWFRRMKTTIDPHKKPSSLIVKGPYRFSRNPIYLALVVIAAGWALWLGALSGVLPVIALAFVLNRRFVLPEEAGLRNIFGAEADTYIKKTRRWV